MDKGILKKFAIESRADLMKKMSDKINSLYVQDEFSKEQKGDMYVLSNDIHTLTLPKTEYDKRELLIKRIKDLSLEQVIEESAYTWFNRIIAIRYMELNDMLPLSKNNQSLGIKVLSSKENTVDPEILKFTYLINPELDIDFKKEKYAELKDDNEKFRYVLLLVCKKLGKVIPQVFDGNTDYIDILIPDNLLNDTGIITKLINDVPEENYNQVEIIGWLYQYYNQTEKDRVISAKKAYKKNEIAYATQLFTPDWIVKYMVENSLGKYWVEHSNDISISQIWKYFIKDNIKQQQGNLKPTEITFIDPCCGSGHILVYAFEVFYQIYISAGYNKNDIPELILKNNLYGLDIDDRAGQLSILSILLKAREYDKNIFNKEIVRNLNIMSIQESNTIQNCSTEYLPSEIKDKVVYLIEKFSNAKEIGSLLLVENYDYSNVIEYLKNNINLENYILIEKLPYLIKQLNILSKKYNIVVTNPPYMNTTSMSNYLKEYIIENFKEYKYDLFSCFITRNIQMNVKDGYLGFMTPYVWMFISSYENLRNYILTNTNISSLIQLEYSSLEEAIVPLCTFVLNNNSEKVGTYIRLTDYKGGMSIQEKEYLKSINKDSKDVFIINKDKFNNIPNKVIAYWISEQLQSSFENGKRLKEIGDTRQGMATSDNNRFLRLWEEVDFNRIGIEIENSQNAKDSKLKWFPYNKGGNYRKWYGNIDYVINYLDDGKEVKEYATQLYKTPTRTIKSMSEYFKESISWSKISSGNIAFRYYPKGFIFDVAGCCIFNKNEEDRYTLLAFLNSNVSNEILKMLSPTLNYEAGQIASLPILKSENSDIINLVKNNIAISKIDWDSFETSWDFNTHPLIEYKCGTGYSNNLSQLDYKIEDSYKEWEKNSLENFKILKHNEEELNKIFIDIYGLKDELTPEVAEKDITIRKADRLRDIKSFISYAVGCMFGRYSLDKDGLIYAGGEFDSSMYKTYNADTDNVIPITNEAYFADDIVVKFKEFVKVVYGGNTLNENLEYIAETLGKRNLETSEETIRRYFNNDFYNDHVKIYQKRPIYWQFDSGKKNGFKCLVYMHRYNENLIPKIRLDYLHKIQTTYEKIINDINTKLTRELSLSDKKEAQNRLAELSNKLQETKEYDEKIAYLANQRINIDLDDGIVVNYEKLKDVLSKIK